MSHINDFKEFMEKKFTQLPAYEKLMDYAQHPIDLTDPKVLTVERISEYYAEACGYRLLYGTERIDPQVMEALVELAQQSNVLKKMNRMQNGEIVNCIKGYQSENRAALHTATRDFFENQNTSLPAREAAQMAEEQLNKLKLFILDIEKSNRFTDMIMIGIGGSDLGPYANYLALEYLKKKDRNLFFINNVDPDNAAEVLREVNLESALVVVISKSGTTLETRTNAEFVRNRFIEAGLKPERHFISITGEGSPMDDSKQYFESFYIWDWIGGRYSSTSMVGGVLIAFACGFNAFYEFLRGANAMDKVSLKENIHNNLPLLGALLEIWNRNFLNYQTLAVIPYSYGLRRFSAHIQQLSMESNGKHIDKLGEEVDFPTGEIIWGEPGTNAQHSFYQLIHQGTNIVPLEFIGYSESQYDDDILYQGTTSQEKLISNLFAQAIGLATGMKSSNPNKEFKGNRPSHILLGNKLTPFSLGALLSYYENKVAFQGFIWNINSFDQEGVQLGKVLADKIIDSFKAKRFKNCELEYPLGNALIKHLEK